MSGTLLVTPDGEFEAQVKRAFDGDLDAERYWDDHIPRTQPETAVRQIAQSQPQVVVLGPGLAPPVTIALAEAFDLLHPEVCVVIVAKPSTRLWERALRAGVREIITPGSEDDHVREALTRAGSAAARRRATNSSIAQREEVPRGRVITVMSPKGGAGKTTVATNLATRLALAAPGRVAIIDLDLQFGDVASALGIGPQATIADAARLGNQLDSTALKVFLEPHPSGLYALVGRDDTGLLQSLVELHLASFRENSRPRSAAGAAGAWSMKWLARPAMALPAGERGSDCTTGVPWLTAIWMDLDVGIKASTGTPMVASTSAAERPTLSSERFRTR